MDSPDSRSGWVADAGPMYGRILLATVVFALGAGVPAGHAAPSNWIGVDAPRSAKAGKPFPLKAAATFDWRLHAPYRRYLAAGVWRQRGDDPCPRSLPIGRRGWTQIRPGLDFYPQGGSADDYATEFIDTKVTLRAPGAYRHCGYVYDIRPRRTSSGQDYGVLAQASALTRVRRG